MIRPTLLGVILVDLSVALAIAAGGAIYGFRDVATAYLDWRAAHPWTFLVSVIAIVGFVAWRRRRLACR